MAIALTAAQSGAASQALTDLHNFFAKPIYYFKEDEVTVITESADHNYFFGGAPDNTETTKITVSGQFNGRIYWNRQELSSVNDQARAIIPNGWVRIIADVNGKEIIEDSVRYKFDDQIFQLAPEADRHGLLEKNFYTYYLKPSP